MTVPHLHAGSPQLASVLKCACVARLIRVAGMHRHILNVSCNVMLKSDILHCRLKACHYFTGETFGSHIARKIFRAQQIVEMKAL